MYHVYTINGFGTGKTSINMRFTEVLKYNISIQRTPHDINTFWSNKLQAFYIK